MGRDLKDSRENASKEQAKTEGTGLFLTYGSPLESGKRKRRRFM